MSEMFPDAHAEGRDDRVAATWDLSWPLPVPRFQLACPHCEGRYVLKGWKFHQRNTGSPRPYRCDVRLKCLGCGHVPIFGVAISKEEYDRGAAANRTRTSGWIEWRQGKQILTDAGFFSG